MNNVLNATTIPSLRRCFRKITDYVRFIFLKVALIASSVLILLAIIRWCFFAFAINFTRIFQLT